MTVRLIQGDCRDVLKTLPDESVHCVVTSPPYFGLRDYGVAGQIGLERTPEEFIAEIVAVFREVRRVLRSDGTCWVNLGDSYAGGGRGGNPADSPFRKQATNAGSLIAPTPLAMTGAKPKDLLMMPARVALALQADGWWLRSDIIWAKPNPMPESVQGSHSFRHMVTMADYERLSGVPYSGERAGEDGTGDVPVLSERSSGSLEQGRASRSDEHRSGLPELQLEEEQQADHARLVPCPGCDKCVNGYITRLSAGRPTSAHEHVFLLTKSARYFYDAEAVKEEAEYGRRSNFRDGGAYLYQGSAPANGVKTGQSSTTSGGDPSAGRNMRNVLTIATAPYSGAHFATFPPKLIEPFIKAGTSERGCCPTCGKGWVRAVERIASSDGRRNWAGKDECLSNPRSRNGGFIDAKSETIGWRPSCDCPAAEPIPCTVLDPFAGAGTVGLVCDRLGRNAILIDLSLAYMTMAQDRIVGDAPLFAEVTK